MPTSLWQQRSSRRPPATLDAQREMPYWDTWKQQDLAIISMVPLDMEERHLELAHLNDGLVLWLR
jgi:hypothetical protein